MQVGKGAQGTHLYRAIQDLLYSDYNQGVLANEAEDRMGGGGGGEGVGARGAGASGGQIGKEGGEGGGVGGGGMRSCPLSGCTVTPRRENVGNVKRDLV
jgi:hypothetical protein